MERITILPETTQRPLTLMGMRAGVCYNSDISDDDKNRKRGIECLKSGHGRVMEYVNVEAIIEGYSSRVIREWYTHIGGSPTRLQESTRYCNCENFDYVEPNLNYEQASVYKVAMGRIKESYKALLAEGVSKEDAANILPLGMTTKIVDKRNLRNIVDMSHVRMCNSAYWEYRELFHDYKEALKNISDEWEYIVNNYFKPKCDITGVLQREEELRTASRGRAQMNSDRTMKLYGKLESLYADKEQWEERIAFLNRLDSFVETICGDMAERNMLKKIISDEVFTVEKRSFRVDFYINHTKKEYEHERTADGSNEKTEELK